jgi:surface antigen
MTKLVPLTLLAFALTACASPGPKAQAGAVVGATAGGLNGAAAGGGEEGIVGGVLLKGLLGGAVGDALDQADREYAARSAQHTLESAPIGTTGEWGNPDSGHHGTVTPTRTYQAPSGQYCREFQQTITAGGTTEEAYGTACRQSDGRWQIVQ